LAGSQSWKMPQLDRSVVAPLLNGAQVTPTRGMKLS